MHRRSPLRALPVVAVLSSLVPSAEPLDTPAATSLLELELTPSGLGVTAPAEAGTYLESLGEEAGLWGTLAAGIEAWTYPFQLFDGLALAAGLDGETLIEARELARLQTAEPHWASFRLVHDRFRIEQVLFAPREEREVAVLLRVDSPTPMRLRLRFRPTLAPMLSTPPTRLEESWDARRSLLSFRDPARRTALEALFPAGATLLRAEPRPGPLPGTHVELELLAGGTTFAGRWLPVVFRGLLPGESATAPPIETVRDELPAKISSAARAYEGLLARAPEVTTPERSVNNALRWSVVSLGQLHVRNPHLGAGLVSGYSPSGGGTRPRYAWFFEEPMLTQRAYHLVGQTRFVRDAFRLLLRYQRDDGKTPHEVPQSVAWLPGGLPAYRWAYMHSDGPVHYLAAWANDYRSTGDLAFQRRSWTALSRTLQWCFSAVDPEDGLVRIEAGDWGSAESSFRPGKDTALAAVWVHALEGIAEIAEALGEEETARRCRETRARAEESIETKLWDEEAGAYLWALDRQGRPLRSLVPHHSLGIWFGSFREDRARKQLETFASADFRSDWGVRSLSMADPKYDPESYQQGSVWPVWNAGIIVGDFRHGRPVSGFRNWYTMLGLRTLRQLGPMPEVLHGRFYKKTAECVPHQQFSEIAIVNGFFDGLLGLSLDVPRKRVRLGPWLPPQWDELRVRRIPLGTARLDLQVERATSLRSFHVGVRSGTGYSLHFDVPLPAGSEPQTVLAGGKPLEFERGRSAAAESVRFDVPVTGEEFELHVAARFTGGVEWFPVDRALLPGDTSRNLRVIRGQFNHEAATLSLLLEGLPGVRYSIDLVTPWTIARSGDETTARYEKRPDGWRVVFEAPTSPRRTASGFVRFELPLRFSKELRDRTDPAIHQR